ncbi:RNA-binding protein 25-like isoform X2 [Dysidea avara]|uniref:RNA-binding protein 25-like isoform X2 n=1 Tax=Dysidea avara TaxID=196820 RepID=UPI003327BED4
MNQLPQIMQPPMGVVPPQLTQVSMMPGTGMFFPPPPLGMHLGMTPGLLGMVPPGAMMTTQVQPTIAIQPPKPEDTIVNNISASEIKVATTVFVGNISDKATDTLIRQILLRCGVINAWKRVQGASGKMQAFGFCEYSDPEATLRALRLLHNFRLGDKSLVVKVDSKTRKELIEYITRKKLVKTGASEEELKTAVAAVEDSGDGPLNEELDEITKDADSRILESINNLVRDNVDVLTMSRTVEEGLMKSVEESLLHMAKQSGKADENVTNLADVDMEDDMKHIVSDEIRRFRQSYKEKEEQKIVERKREKELEKEIDKDKESKDDIKEKDRESEKSSRRDYDRHKKELTQMSERSRERVRSRSPIERSSRRESTRGASDKHKDRVAAKEKERERSYRDEEAYEQRRVDKKQREREAAYKERLKHWETRERKKLKEYEREKTKEDEKQEEMEKDKRHLAEFLEDYDDDKDDTRYYKGSAFARRRREREIELESDEKDRQHEREEIEALRLNMMKKQVEGTEPENEEDSDDVQSDLDLKEEEDIPLSKDSEEPVNSISSYPPIQVQSAPNVSPTFKPVAETSYSPDSTSYNIKDEPMDEDLKPKLTFGLKSGGSSTSGMTTTSKPSTVEKVFNQEEEELFVARKQRKLVPIEYSEEEQQAVGRSNHMSSDERKNLVQNLIKNIPTERDELFAYTVKWECLDDNVIEKRVKPWINKKIIEYIGEEEATLVEFIANKISTHSSAQEVLNDVAMVLDEEAQVFVVKLWRLLIYETEAKHKGISKSYQ